MAEQTRSLEFDAVLRNWFIVGFTFEHSLVGKIYGDSKGRFPDGRWVMTSAVVTPVGKISSGKVVRTANSRYLLVGRTN